MKYLGSSTIETERLILKTQTMKEQYYLWQLLINHEVNKYFLTVPPKYRTKLLDWNLQKKYYEEEMKHANDKDIFKWSIFLKETGECIGRLSCHERNIEDENITNPNIRGVGWLIDPNYQGQGYATEAAKGMIDYMFLTCDIEKIITGACILNTPSWHLMEKLGFEKLPKTKMIQYTFLDSPVEIYEYSLSKEKYISLLNNDSISKRGQK